MAYPPFSANRMSMPRYGGYYAGGVGGQTNPNWSFLQSILGGIQGSEQDYRKWLSGLLGSMNTNARSQLAGGIGSQLSRTNVAVPGGANALANRYMSSMDDQFNYLQQLINQPSNYTQNLQSALGLTQTFGNMFGQKGMDLSQLNDLLGLGGNKTGFGRNRNTFGTGMYGNRGRW